ncbi:MULTISPECIES: MCE family protein [Mycobacterium]|uniref:Mammalian cell entry protein n=1 Tax=Mycobacterium colombiense TaxID=339268 RepID=A0A329LZX0_9MYCO|nr:MULTISPECIES: MCE family protein [Mycobacterium]MDM4139711.1 MCE family protein [Mycobacterium sp. FLAC0960]RAV13421.1 mammalian cell entry protein [Mycobacterium colombiense]
MAESFKAWWSRRRPLESYNRTWLGLAGLALVAVLVAVSLGIKLLGIGYTHYTAEFLQAATLRPGNPITIAGIEVGHVTSMKLDGDHVEAGLSVRNNIALGKDTRAVIKVMTILGSRYLELVPDGPGSLPAKTISLSQTEVPYDLQSLLEDATTTFEQVDSDQFAQSLAVLGKQLGGVPPLVPQAVANLQTLSTITADRRGQLGTLLKSTQRVVNTLRRQQTNIGHLMDQGQDLLGHLVAREATFHAMFAGLTDLVDQLDKVVVNNRPLLDELFANLHQLTNMVGQHDDLLRNLLQVAPVTLRGLTNATGYGPVVEFNLPNGLAIDSWMCAISGRAKEFKMIQYFKDCK